MSERLLESRIAALRGQVRRLLVLPRPELGGRGRGAAGDRGRPGRLALPPRRRRPPGAPGRRGRRSRLWLGYRHVLRPLVVRFADLDIALRIEERWPGLNDRLASTIQFLRLGPATTIGSARRPCARRRSGRRSRRRGRSTSARRSSTSPILRAAGPGRRRRSRLAAADRRSPPRRRRGSPCGGSSSPGPATAGRSRPTWPSTSTGRRSRSRAATRSRSPCRSARATGPRLGQGHLPLRRRRGGRRAAPRRRGGRVPRPDRDGRPAVHASRSPAATTRARSATSRSRSSRRRRSTA